MCHVLQSDSRDKETRKKSTTRNDKSREKVNIFNGTWSMIIMLIVSVLFVAFAKPRTSPPIIVPQQSTVSPKIHISTAEIGVLSRSRTRAHTFGGACCI